VRVWRGLRLGAPPGRLNRTTTAAAGGSIVYAPLVDMNVNLVALPAWLDERAAKGEFSGVVLLRRDGETVFEHGAGLASRAHDVPNTMSTRFAVASVSKWPLAVTVLRLVERGELDLHAPLVDLLPPDQVPTAVTPELTLHHLLSMSSGLGNYVDDDATTWAHFEGVIDTLPGRGRRPVDLLPVMRDLPANRAPGVAYEYCDTNFVLVGLVVEAVTGREWSSVLADEVLRPVGMSDTAVEEIDRDPARMATGYLVDDGPVDQRRTNVFSLTARGMPDGGMLSTAGDLALFVEALFSGRLLGPDLLAMMQTPQAPSPEDPEFYGYGCLLGVVDGRATVVGHNGGDPGVSCVVAHHPAANATVIVLCNQDRGVWVPAMTATEALGLRDPRA
jgi:CubicO group peptidase (beta-lactamase class C family)